MVMSTTIDGSASVTINSGAILGITSGTVKDTSTGATSYDFTGIPSWVKRITVMFKGVSLSGTATLYVRLGTSGGIVTTGYACRASATGGTGSAYTDGFGMAGSNVAADLSHGMCVLALEDLSTNTWAETSNVYASSNGMMVGAGSVSLSGALTTVRITSSNGTDTFDAGSINILYE
jgi:hypothetical protein